MIYEANDLSRLDRALRRTYLALDIHDCEGAFRALTEALGRYHYARGALVVAHIAAGYSSKLAATGADERLADHRRVLSLATTAFGEVCLDHRIGINMRVPQALQGLGSPTWPSAVVKINEALENARSALDAGDCVEAFLTLRYARSAIMVLIGGMQTLKSVGQAPPDGGTHTFTPIVARLESLETEFIRSCVKGGLVFMQQKRSGHMHGCCGRRRRRRR